MYAYASLIRPPVKKCVNSASGGFLLGDAVNRNSIDILRPLVDLFHQLRRSNSPWPMFHHDSKHTGRAKDNAKIGVVRDGVWFLDSNGNKQSDDCTTDRCIGLGLAEDLPVTGDWNSSGNTKIGSVRDGMCFLDFSGNEQFDDCTTDRCIGLGLAEDLPVTGQWR